MDTDARYSALEHGGLEVYQHSGTPEVVPGSSPPLERRSSLNQPETLHPGQYDVVNKQEHGNYFGQDDGRAPSYSDEARPAYIDPKGKNEAGVGVHEVQSSRSGRRYFGMRKAVFIALVVGLVVLVVAAVVGGVLGTILSRKHSSSSSEDIANSPANSNTTSQESNAPLQAISNTGFATAVSADGSERLLMYYQAPDGRIIENSLVDDSWTLEDESKIDQSVVTTEATPGSPLAAISYTFDSQQYRQVFYVDGSGFVKTTNSTTTTDGVSSTWSEPYALYTDTASSSGTAGLAACVEHEGMNGIRVYFGTSEGYIEENGAKLGYQFNDTSGWTYLSWFEGSDANSGVACVVYNSPDPDAGEQYLNLYMRNATTGLLTQNYYNYAYSNGWSFGPNAWSNMSMAAGSAVAACNDDEQNEYVFYQLQTGMVVRGLVDSDGSSFQTFDNMQTASGTTKLSAAWFDGGALYAFQNGSDSNMWLSNIARNLNQIPNPSTNGAVP